MYDPELDRFKREVHLVHFATHRYGYVRDRKESSRACHVLRHTPTNDKIIVRLDADDHWTYFSVRDDRDCGTVIDFLQKRGGRSLKDVRDELREYLGTPRPEPLVPEPECRRPRQPDVSVEETFARARVADNSRYLNERGIRPETLRDPRFEGTWRLGARDNVLFAHRDDAGTLTGFEIKNRGFTGFATGGHKSAWQSAARADDRAIVITESAIDALSYHQLHPAEGRRSRYVSTAGAPNSSQMQLVGQLLERLAPNSTVVAAVDADVAGEKLAARLEELSRGHARLTFCRDAPRGAKDWNDVLQRHERDFIQSLSFQRRTPDRSGPER